MGPIDRRSFLRGAGAILASTAAGCRSARPTAPAPARPIVIVGAGLAGLVTAHELVKRGRDVRVLEALPRVGGRIRTVRGFRDGLYVEAGATHLIGDDLYALIEELRVPIVETQRPTKLASVFVRGGARTVVAPGETPPEEHPLSPAEAAMTEDARRAAYLGVAARIDPDALAWPADIAALDQSSMADYLRGRGASPGFIAGINAMIPSGDGIETVSALALLRELAGIYAEIARAKDQPKPAHGRRRIADGTDQLPRALAARLAGRVVLGAEVVRIERRADGATVVVADKSGVHRLEAAAVVLTMPFPVMRRLDVDPPWSARKARAIAELDMSPVTRIWLESDRQFWRDAGLSGRAELDLATGLIAPETEQFATTGGVLATFATQARARRFAAQSADARIATMLDDCERAFPGMKQHFVHGDSVAWENEPFARGAYATFRPGQLTGRFADAIAPEGVVHFAGDGTSGRPGWMRGAIASARRVVAELTSSNRR